MLTFPTYDTVDLFAGPGGWSVAAQRLGLREMGIELDPAAHMTRRANGFHTIRASVSELGPRHFPNATGLIASPPCPTFSTAGNGSGRRELTAVLQGIRSLGSGAPVEHTWEDDRTGLTLEPMRWIVEAAQLGRPYQWVALEQVPTVLPVWVAMALELAELGYTVATGNLQAEQYGVAQTRKRAILVARLDGQAMLPAPTHSKYHNRDRTRLDPGVLPWVSMAVALGRDGAMRSNYGTGGDPRNRGQRDTDSPAPTVTGKIDRNRWLRNNAQTRAAVRHIDEPAPTITASNDRAERRWMMGAGTSHTDGQQPRADSEPCHTVTGKGTAAWVDGGRVTVGEASALQSFPPGFIWSGVQTKQYQQVGNAVPPLLGEAVLCAATGRPFVPRRAES